MDSLRKKLVILLADDDPDDRMMASDALARARVLNSLRCVDDGEELMDYLRGVGAYADRKTYPLPGLILLDLNMPRMDGREALGEIKRDEALKRIPVVILTTSKAEEDMIKSYDLGAASYIRKPVSFEALVDLMQVLGRYWIEFVETP